MKRLGRLIMLALALGAPQLHATELSGVIRSSTGKLPDSIEVMADRADKQPVVAGTVEKGRYHIDLPSPGMYRLRLQAKDWDAAPKTIFDPASAGALDFLIYPEKVPEPALAAELNTMGEADQEFRQHIPAKPDAAFFKRWQAEDLQRETRLAQIIAEKGWPMISQVGHQAATSAWLIAQHGSADFLKRCLVLMKAAAEKQEIAPGHLALSIDRVLMQDGQKQLYGSQFQTNSDGKTIAVPIADPEHLDERRASMGMQPFAEYAKNFIQ
jgi:hypothetical protein